MDNATRNQLVVDNMKLVGSISRKYYSRGADRHDLFQAGCIGLINGVDSYDDESGIPVVNCLYSYIRTEIWNHVRKTNWRVIHLGDEDVGVYDNNEEVPDYGVNDLLAVLHPLDAWVIRRLFGIPESPGIHPHVFTIKGRRRSLPVHQKDPWTVTQISKKTGMTTRRIREIERRCLNHLRSCIQGSSL